MKQKITLKKIAKELRINGTAIPRKYKSVSVLFTDFKDFTQISETMTPNELVDELNTFFKAFDNVITKLNIEKMKNVVK